MNEERKLAEDALQRLTNMQQEMERSIESLRAALAQPEPPLSMSMFANRADYDAAVAAQPEPAALEDIPACMFCGELIEPAAPREPLTDEDIKELAHQHRETLWPRKDRSDVQTTAIPFARAVIAALGGPRNE